MGIRYLVSSENLGLLYRLYIYIYFFFKSWITIVQKDKKVLIFISIICPSCLLDKTMVFASSFGTWGNSRRAPGCLFSFLPCSWRCGSSGGCSGSLLGRPLMQIDEWPG